ncbi:MAG TPA: hypothetical protein VK759_04420, partial [Rhizomicrobium sp.]|nr:hypothetical protein [Rhizomicrobium sp.]
LAMVLWLFVYDRSAAWRFIISGIAFLLAALLAFRLAYGIDLLTVLNSSRIYSFHNFILNLGNWLVWGTIPILGILLLLLLRHRDKYVVLCVLYAFIAIVVGAIFFGGDGVDVNAMFDADIALALGAGLVLNRLPARNILAFVYVVPVALALWQFRDSQWLERDFWLHPLQTEAEATNRDIAFLRKQRGPALCEMLSLCYWARKRVEVDVFNVGEQFATGTRSDKALTELVARRYFRTIQFDSLSPFALTPRIREAVMRNYRIDHTNDDGVFLIPR